MGIVTKTGDAGQSSLLSGERVAKARHEKLPPGVQVWLNRLSDDIWMLALLAEGEDGD